MFLYLGLDDVLLTFSVSFGFWWSGHDLFSNSNIYFQ
jgi:hypothetical protein